MKIIIVLSVLLTCLLPIFVFCGGPSFTPPPYDKIVDDLMSRSSKKLEKRYNIRLIGIHEAMMGCVREMGFSFQVYRALEKNVARTILVDCIQEFLSDINQDEKIRPYLEVYPFDLNHVDIMLFANTPNRDTFYHPNLTVATASRGKIRYSTNDLKDKYKYKAEEVESFEDAVKIVKGEKSPPPSEIK